MKIEQLWRFVTRQSFWMAVPMAVLKALKLTSVSWVIVASPVLVPMCVVFILAGLEWLLRFYAKKG